MRCATPGKALCWLQSGKTWFRMLEDIPFIEMHAVVLAFCLSLLPGAGNVYTREGAKILSASMPAKTHTLPTAINAYPLSRALALCGRGSDGVGTRQYEVKTVL